MKKLAVLFIFLVFGTSIAGIWGVWNYLINQPASLKGEEVVFEIEPGSAFVTIAKNLQSKGLIKNAGMFRIYSRITRQDSKVKTGEYLLNTNMRPSDILVIISSGKSIERKITISEGLNIFEIAELFEAGGLCSKSLFLEKVKNKELIKKLLGEEVNSLEGYLYPETYSYTKYTLADDLIEMMVKSALIKFKDIEDQAAVVGFKRHQVFTLASIVEKETGAPEERPLISSVFHNRLRKNMLLQTDPTIIYGKAIKYGKLEISITKEDIHAPTEYNTYVVKGLPPGPIANPGIEALKAAVNPAQSDYLFFVSKNDGTHTFTQEYKDHQKAVKDFQQNKKAREGKSWRDLNKRK